MLSWLEIQNQIERYVERRRQAEAEAREQKKQLLHVFQDPLSKHWEQWKQRAAETHLSHLIPDFDEDPALTYPVESNPPSGVILASDGSQIFPSRHEIAPIALLHISRIRIDYVNYQSPPVLESVPQILLREDFNEWADPEREPTFEELVSDRRALEEMNALVYLAQKTQSESTDPHLASVLALTDGSLVLWRLAGREETRYEKRVIHHYTKALDWLRELQVPVAGYISRSGSREVVNLVKLVLAGDGNDLKPLANSDTSRECGITDTALFGELLKPGERSILFHSRSKILKTYGEHRIAFFYLHVGEEIAKLEIPRWVADSQTLVDRVAALCLRQCRLGGGYPVILSEAHEQAVIRSADRERFYALLEQNFIRQGMRFNVSAKQMRKRAAIL